jgi:hypothetical protein
VAGLLPLADLPALPEQLMRLAVVRCQLDVAAGGPVRLRLNGTRGLRLWLDGKPLEVRDALDVNLATGPHTLTAILDLGQRKDGLRLEEDDVPGSPARLNLVGGK